MDQCLGAVLAGQVDLQAALAWLESDSNTGAPWTDDVLPARNAAGKATVWGPNPGTRFLPAQLRAYVLDHVRDQAVPVLQAGEACRTRIIPTVA